MSELKAHFVFCHFPNLDGWIGCAGRNQMAAVWSECQGGYSRRRQLERGGFEARGRIVKTDPVCLADGEEPAVRTERDPAHPLGTGNGGSHVQRIPHRRL